MKPQKRQRKPARTPHRPGPGRGGRGADSARERLISAASDLFCRNGITATGIDAVVEKAGTAKTTLYSIFGSKDKLVEAVLESEGSSWRTWFLAEIDAAGSSPAEKLAGLFDSLERWFADDHFFGCPFINAVAEHDKADPRMREIALRHKSIVMERITSLAAATGADDPAELAHEIGMLMDGAIVTALITQNPQVARTARHAAEAILAQHTQRQAA